MTAQQKAIAVTMCFLLFSKVIKKTWFPDV